MCKAAFTKLVGIGESTLCRIVRHICVNDGIVPEIVDGRKGSKEHMTEKKHSVVVFLHRYGEEFGYPCPSSHPSGGDTWVEEEIILLPAGTQKYKVYEDYCDAILGVRHLDQRKHSVRVSGAQMAVGEDTQGDGDSGDEIVLPDSDSDSDSDSDDEFDWDEDVQEVVSYCNFIRIWKKDCRWIRIAQGASDMCDFCGRFEREKLDGWQVVVTAHKLLGHQERQYYKKLIEPMMLQNNERHEIPSGKSPRIFHFRHIHALEFHRNSWKIHHKFIIY